MKTEFMVTDKDPGPVSTLARIRVDVTVVIVAALTDPLIPCAHWQYNHGECHSPRIGLAITKSL